jgi:tetratricopeptide (TPR) repeat protein
MTLAQTHSCCNTSEVAPRLVADRKAREENQALVPVLLRALRELPETSAEAREAYLQLAEILVDTDPWGAALAARKVLQHAGVATPQPRAWAALGLANTLLGNYRFARTAYERALSAAPHDPWYCHNLGHLLDMGLQKPDQALPYLQYAFEQLPESPDVAASYAHVLVQVGEVCSAQRVLESMPESAERGALLHWVRTLTQTSEPEPHQAEVSQAQPELPVRIDILMSRLPFTPQERTRIALVYAQARGLLPDASPGELGAAAALAYVESTGFALSAHEVTATFRVALAKTRLLARKIRAQLGFKGSTRRPRTRR